MGKKRWVAWAVAAAWLGAFAAAAAIGPLSLQKVKDLLAVPVPDSALAGNIRKYGLAFEPTPGVVSALKKLGAGPQAVALLERIGAEKRKAREAAATVAFTGGPTGRSETNLLGMTFVELSAGSFPMGSPRNEADRSGDEGPQHRVTITRGFWLGKTEVTQGQWEAVMGSNPSRFKDAGKDAPVEQVSWDDVQVFIQKLNERDPGKGYRLPTEAEWEYACRAGTGTAFCYGNRLGADQANFDGNHPYGGAAKGEYRQTTTRVGSFGPNAWGLHDMHGNVWEWCADWYDSGYYKESPSADPRGPSSGSVRVVRGGGWSIIASICRSANRLGYSPDSRDILLGFRLARGQ